MSNRQCNYCIFQSMLASSKEKGRILTTKLKDGGVDVYIDGEWVCWFMELPDNCRC